MAEPTTPPARFVTLYRRAFREHRLPALWNVQELEDPAPEDALAVARSLRLEGGRDARLLAEDIEQAIRTIC